MKVKKGTVEIDYRDDERVFMKCEHDGIRYVISAKVRKDVRQDMIKMFLDVHRHGAHGLVEDES